MKKKTIIQLLIISALAITPCYGADTSDLRNILVEKGQQYYFPTDATYKKLPNICNKQKCFTIMTVEYVSETRKGMRRLAVFSSSRKYIGCYSGLSELPVGVEGDKLKFKKSKMGDIVVFKENDPPSSIWVDGMVYNFEKL